MKTYKISSGFLKSQIQLPRSKSYANRLLILAALAKKETILSHLPRVDDVQFLLESLKLLGVKVKVENNKHYLFGGFPICSTQDLELDVGEGGTTARFLAAMLSLSPHKYRLKLSGKLSERPWEELIDALESLGARVSLMGHELTIQGPVSFKDTELIVSAKRSTQFATALALAFSEEVKVIPEHLNSSATYWKLTTDLIQKFKATRHFDIPVDWSSASYPVCFAALTQETFFPGLHYDLHQADAKLFDILNKLGAITKSTEEGITISPLKDRKHSLSFDMTDCLDLAPALSFLVAHLEGVHHLKGVKHLIYKESDRLQEIIRLLEIFGRKVVYYEESDTLTVHGSEVKIKNSLDISTAPDHRMVMTASLFLKFHGGGTLHHIQSIEKSFSDYILVCGL